MSINGSIKRLPLTAIRLNSQLIIFNVSTMSTEKYATYTDAYREFRMNISENDFHDNYPETAEMTLAICSGLRYHYMREYRSMTADQSVQLIETFAKRCAKLAQYEDTLDFYLYGPESIIKHGHWSDAATPAFDEWILLCHAYGLIYLTPHYQENIIINLAKRNRWVDRNTIQLRLLDKDVKRRSELQQKLIDMGKLVNDIDSFNHIYKYVFVSSNRLPIGQQYKYVIDSYYDGHVDERLGTDTIYEWILNDDANKFQQWYNTGGLHEYNNSERGNDKSLKYVKDIASHILTSNAIGIIRFIIMNRVHEFLDMHNGRYALMDPWIYPVNDAECFRLLQAHFTKEHEAIIAEFIHSDYDNDYSTVKHVYRYIRSEIAEAIYHEIMDISMRLSGTDDMYLRLYIAVEMAKFGHIGPIESLDWETATRTLSDKDGYAIKRDLVTIKLARLMGYRRSLIATHSNCLPFGMNPSTAVYLHDLFAENGLIRIAVCEPSLVAYCGDAALGIKVDRYKQIVMAEYRDDCSFIEDTFDVSIRPEDQIDMSSL